MSYTLRPNEHYRTSFKYGMVGWDVATIQIALNDRAEGHALEVDGEFGPLTKAAVERAQRAVGAVVDGIAGPETQSRMCVAASRLAQGHLPHDLLKGIVLGESSGIIPTTSPAYADGSRDYGPWQAHSLDPLNPASFFKPLVMAERVAQRLAAAFAKFEPEPYCQHSPLGPAQAAWRLAVLSYNWPEAAEQIALGREAVWRYADMGGHMITLNEPAKWVEAMGLPGVVTGMDWCEFYTSSKCVYVTNWT